MTLQQESAHTLNQSKSNRLVAEIDLERGIQQRGSNGYSSGHDLTLYIHGMDLACGTDDRLEALAAGKGTKRAVEDRQKTPIRGKWYTESFLSLSYRR